MKQIPNHCSKCGEHYRSVWHLNNCKGEEHRNTPIAYAGCKCKYCKKASKQTQKIMSGLEKILRGKK